MAEFEGVRVHPVALDQLGSASGDAAQILADSLRRSTTLPPTAAFGNLGISGEVHRAFAAATRRGEAVAGTLSAALQRDVDRLAHTAATDAESDHEHGSVLGRIRDSPNPLD
ncbi:MAG: hypothetical protein M3O55_01240 [Actinomycetota bacterium]|nr:hypothetical protein [Actinomycetota bacterium]